MFDLQDRNILVTGGTGHLGKQMCIGLARAGANVWINGRDSLKVAGVVNEIIDLGFSAEAAPFDICDKLSCISFFQKNKERVLHGVVNNAYSGESGSIETSIEDQYRTSYEISVVSSHNLIKCALPALRKAAECSFASVVNICSMYGIVSPDIRMYSSLNNANPPFYGAAKAALMQWTRYAACEYGAENIRFNAISPGPFPSASVQRNSPDFVTQLVNKVPLARIGEPHELIGPVVFLLSTESSYVNGANIVVDGGWTSW